MWIFKLLLSIDICVCIVCLALYALMLWSVARKFINKHPDYKRRWSGYTSWIDVTLMIVRFIILSLVPIVNLVMLYTFVVKADDLQLMILNGLEDHLSKEGADE